MCRSAARVAWYWGAVGCTACGVVLGGMHSIVSNEPASRYQLPGVRVRVHSTDLSLERLQLDCDGTRAHVRRRQPTRVTVRRAS